MMILKWIYLTFVHINLFHHVNLIYQIPKYCREKERPIVMEEYDEYLLVDVILNSTLLLECRFCNIHDPNPEPKIWYWQDIYQNEKEKEVELGMESNLSLNRIYMTSDLSLVIKEVHLSDAGIYRCHGVNGQEIENKYNYRIEPVFESQTVINIQRGNITEWEKYREANFIPVSLRFSVSKMTELSNLRKSGITLEVLSELGLWGPCENCVNNYGIQSCETLCRIKRKINETYQTNNSIVHFFKKSPIIPCRSYILAAKFPSISRAVKDLPPFILEEKCSNCEKVKKIKKYDFKYKTRHVLREGSHLVVSCPESSSENNVVWRKDGLIMKKGVVTWYKKKDRRSKTLVDVFSTLYLMEVTNNEEGNYTCYVDGEKMMTMKVVVASKAKLLTEAFFRHSKYLAFILLLTSFCYCAGLIQSYKQKSQIDRDSYVKLENLESDEDLEAHLLQF